MPFDDPVVLSENTHARQREIEKVVQGVIAEYGYYSAIHGLVNIVDRLAAITKTDVSKESELRMWSLAVKDAIKQHIHQSTFAQRISEADAIRARGLGISLG